MATKRKAEEFDLEYDNVPDKEIILEKAKKHTLDSDEEDSGDDETYNVMNENDIEGEEDGVSGIIEGEIKITPFNMKEELEEGHFDREGHFQWDKNKEIKDNWLDNIDWVKVKTDKKYIEKNNRCLADSSDSDEEPFSKFHEIESYKQIFELMQPGENIKKTLQRLGGNTAKLSSVERWRRKKAGIVDENAEIITKLTELANEILTKTGNMDIYEERYEVIQRKISRSSKGSTSQAGGTSSSAAELDMYADDFDMKEKDRLNTNSEIDPHTNDQDDLEPDKKLLSWEYKWKQDDSDVHGPFSTEQMQKWVDENYFKDGVYVRKVGENTQFYSSNRIDFELYI